MASPTSSSLSLLLLSPSPSRLLRRLPAACSHLPPPRRLALAPVRPRIATLAAEPAPGDAADPAEQEHRRDVLEELVEVGYVSGVHGVRGDVLVAPRTDFPHLRFATPGKRWLRARAAGKQELKELELVRGRAHQGKKSWIISFDGINTLEEARQMVGSVILVRTEDRPELEKDEFYSLDLVGMKVILKETGKHVGTVAQVFNFGAGDLLYVMVDSAEGPALQPNSINQDSSSSGGEHIWIPFAEDIVPDVDVERREMQITPPKGLLELNARSDKRSKKERRAMEWKERKKLQHRLNAAKKILLEMDQGHILEGLRTGDKAQKASFAKQIGNIDFQLFRHAMSSVSKQIDRVASSSLSRKNTVRVPYKTLGNHEDREKYAFTGEINKGLEILLKPKAAIVLVGNDSADSDLTVDVELQKVLNSFSELMEVEEKCIAVPFIIISPAGQVESVRNCLVENDYFGLDRQKVWVLGEMELPIVSISSGSNNKKILLKSPWEILQRPAGSGGIFSLLASSKILDTLNGMGAEYVQICSLNNSFAVGHPLFFGAVSSRGADVGVKLCKTSKMEDHFDVIVSMSHLNRISKDVTKLRFSAHQEQHVHAAHVNGEWITVQPEAPNSYRLHSDVTCVLDSCSPDKVCVMEVFE